jgi:hypothetical protein
LTYSEWERLPEGHRAMYIAGAFDSLIAFAINDDHAKTNSHYQQCILNAKMNNVQLANEGDELVVTRGGALPTAWRRSLAIEHPAIEDLSLTFLEGSFEPCLCGARRRAGAKSEQSEERERWRTMLPALRVMTH